MSDLRLSEITDEHLEIARKAVEDELVDWRDRRLSTLRKNGLVIYERDGSPSSTIRFGFEDAMRIAIKALSAVADTPRREDKK